MTEACTCAPYGFGGDGPEIDCPAHGAECVCGRKIGLHPPGEITPAKRRGENKVLLFVVEGCHDD